MSVLYNDNDPFVCAWLAELVAAGELPEGGVAEGGIGELRGDMLQGYTQCHFFAGIGGWPLALKLAGWPDDVPVWTGSCPCQPFSVAGKRKGASDERHLWPDFLRLIAECRPPVIFGEQVASKDGRLWLAGVRADLEALGYAVGAADLCAAGVGAPHIRQRLYWVAARGLEVSESYRGDGALQPISGEEIPRSLAASGGGRLADANQGQCGGITNREGSEFNREAAGWQQGHGEPQPSGADGGLADTEHPERRPEREADCEAHGWNGLGGRSDVGGVGDSYNAGSQGRSEHTGERANQRTPWAASVFINCADGKARRVEPSIFPLAHGVSNRVGLLRGAGNAIVPALAAEFIKAFLDAQRGTA